MRRRKKIQYFLGKLGAGWTPPLVCLRPCVLFQRTDPDSVIGVSPAVLIRSSSQDSEVSTVVGEHHTGILVGGGGLRWRLRLVSGQLGSHVEMPTRHRCVHGIRSGGFTQGFSSSGQEGTCRGAGSPLKGGTSRWQQRALSLAFLGPSPGEQPSLPHFLSR